MKDIFIYLFILLITQHSLIFDVHDSDLCYKRDDPVETNDSQQCAARPCHVQSEVKLATNCDGINERLLKTKIAHN